MSQCFRPEFPQSMSVSHVMKNTNTCENDNSAIHVCFTHPPSLSVSFARFQHRGHPPPFASNISVRRYGSTLHAIALLCVNVLTQALQEHLHSIIVIFPPPSSLTVFAEIDPYAGGRSVGASTVNCNIAGLTERLLKSGCQWAHIPWSTLSLTSIISTQTLKRNASVRSRAVCMTVGSNCRS